MSSLPGAVRLVSAPGALRGVELEVLGWRTEYGETMVRCRLVDGSVGTIPARWTDLRRVTTEPRVLGVVASPASWRLLGERIEVLRSRRPRRERRSGENGGSDVGTARVGVQREVTAMLARLLARLLEAERHE